MAELSLAPCPVPDGLLVELAEGVEPIAEHNFNRKKMFSLEQGMGKLQKTARQQHEVVSQLESGMRSMISETDLRRAIGLAFQEFESRLEDTFQDSNRKCLSMFSKREEVIELQGLIERKVNWAEYNTALKKISELRQYIDTMGESVFIGHRDALNSQFAKKADKDVVDEALKSKANFGEVNDVRARLERLESLVSHTDKKQTAKMEALREEVAGNMGAQYERLQAKLTEHSGVIAAIRDERAAFVERLGGAEAGIGALSSSTERLQEAQELVQEHQEGMIQSISSMQEQLATMEAEASQKHQDLQVLVGDVKAFRESSEQRFGELSTQANSSKGHLKFLMEETDMIKRRSREATKSSAAKFKEISDEQDRHTQQLAALEKVLKKQEREVRAIENKTVKAADDSGALRALMPPEPEATDPSERLKGVLDQLQKIAAGGPPHELAGVEWNGQRPPLPYAAGGEKRGMDADWLRLQLPGITAASDAAPIDSARGLGTSSVRGMYGLSPRMSPGGGNSARARRKR